MKILQEIGSGVFRAYEIKGAVTSFLPLANFTKGCTAFRDVEGKKEPYNLYEDCLKSGFKLVEMPDSLKSNLARDSVIKKLSSLDLPAHTLAMAISGDSEAMDKITKAEALKAVLREELKAIK